MEWNGRRNGMGGGMERNRIKEEWNGRRNGRSSVKLLHVHVIKSSTVANY